MENGSDGGGVVQTSGRGRGRPRASYAQTGELDLSLIREYKNRPSLYDRNSKRFKDKVFTAQQWQMISHKLGYDVSLLKDRMLQLRNRYNIEKRRMEQCNEDNPTMKTESVWPLYGSLNFLSCHIRSRRSYKSFEKVESPEGDGGDDTYDTIGEEGMHNTAAMQEEDDEDGAGGDENNGDQMINTDAQVDVKVELHASSSDEEYESNDPECEFPVSTVPKIIIKSLPKASATASYGSTIVNGQHNSSYGNRQNDLTVKFSATSSMASTPNQRNGVQPKLTLRRIENRSSSSSSKYMPITPQQQHLAHFNLGSNNSNQRTTNTCSTSAATNATTSSAATNSFNNKPPSPAMNVPNSHSNNSNNNLHPPKLKRNTHRNGNGTSNIISSTAASSSPLDDSVITILPPDESASFNAKRARLSSSLTTISSGGGIKPSSGGGGGGGQTDNGHLLAFGEFIGRSLCQLHPDIALQFIPKFTNEIVQALLLQDTVDTGTGGDLNAELMTSLPNYTNGASGGCGGD